MNMKKSNHHQHELVVLADIPMGKAFRKESGPYEHEIHMRTIDGITNETGSINLRTGITSHFKLSLLVQPVNATVEWEDK